MYFKKEEIPPINDLSFSFKNLQKEKHVKLQKVVEENNKDQIIS